MNTVHLKAAPVSTNQLYVGKRWKSKRAKQFEHNVANQLAVFCADKTLPAGELSIAFRFGTTRRQDVDNSVKCVLDVICKHYGIDDRRFTGISLVRVPVPKGSEFITFRIMPYRPSDYPELIGLVVPTENS